MDGIASRNSIDFHEPIGYTTRMEPTTRIFVYRNLHKKCWSLKNVSTGIVQEHADEVHMISVKFKVSQKGRDRVLREKSKNVHAGVQGVLTASTVDLNDGWFRVRYNPYLFSSFVDSEENPIHGAGEVFMTSDGKVFVRKESI